MGRVKNIWASNIYYYVTTLSLFHFFRNRQNPEKWSVSFKFFLNASVVICWYPQIYIQFQF